MAEEFEQTEQGFPISNDFIIAVLLWVDDIVSCAEGTEDQKEMLLKIHQFATKHKIKWGQDKCSVMRVGKHKDKETEWKIGDMNIKESKKNKHLGDIMSNDGKNTENLTAQKTAKQSTTTHINTIASSEILCGMRKELWGKHPQRM